MIWLEFIFCTLFIFFSGILLVRNADALADQTGMGRTWIGLMLLATITSLPELATGISAVTVSMVPDIAAGDVFGSCVFNLLLIGVLDLIHRPGSIFSKVDRGHILSAGFGAFLIALVSFGIVLAFSTPPLSWFGIGPFTPLILIFWVFMVRTIFIFEKGKKILDQDSAEGSGRSRGQGLGPIYLKISLNAGVIIGAGIWLPSIGHRISELTGWGDTFVGNLLVAASTSLPEIVTSFAALKIGAPDLAVANLFGSNLFNIAVLGMDDIAFTVGPLFHHISPYHLVSAFSAILMTGFCILGLTVRPQKPSGFTGKWVGLSLVGFYIINGFLLFFLF